MNRVLLILFFALTMPWAGVQAQNIVFGERVPELKVSGWLSGRTPGPAQFTYVEFFHSSNKACLTSLQRLKEMSSKFGTKLRVVIITHEKEEKIAPLLAPFLAPGTTVALDSDSRIFNAFGVSYVPFGVLVDAKNRALWLGNSLQLTPEIIEKSIR